MYTAESTLVQCWACCRRDGMGKHKTPYPKDTGTHKVHCRVPVVYLLGHVSGWELPITAADQHQERLLYSKSLAWKRSKFKIKSIVSTESYCFCTIIKPKNHVRLSLSRESSI